MKIDIDSQVFSKKAIKNTLDKNVDSKGFSECNWFLKDEKACGGIKDIRGNGMCFFAYNLNCYQKNKIIVSHDAPLYKLHFEFDDELKDTSKSGTKEGIHVKKGRFELLFNPQENSIIKRTKETKNAVELYFEESYLRNIISTEFTQLLVILKVNSKEKAFINYGVFITDDLINIINSIKNCAYAGAKRSVFLELKIKELTIVALAIYMDHYHEDEEIIATKEALQSVENYMKLNLKKELNITELSVLAGMNTSKFKKSFKQLYGTTVFKYITSLRIEKAKTLIQQKSYTISQASYEVGYKNAQHFTVAFKKKLGYLPSELKK
ncbi:helix-turn-helix domain-containing protein [Polaribacter sp. SA4-12]|uniref:helix-turn-helix domain-containing protein n=1 Tax=Polaribacter sp. SA4-12 TaxID=1312072 RepID=UPI000B3C5AB9|nr:AraC family transcriptional regulator [Polaribacter sp. SA4-12]ARV14147.1 hypothetical protein BTO07_02815 [Polaribacter sp. SA4-12]